MSPALIVGLLSALLQIVLPLIKGHTPDGYDGGAAGAMVGAGAAGAAVERRRKRKDP